MPMSAQDPRYRRDVAQWRIRRLSWLIAGGGAGASAVLGVAFAQLLPGHAAAASTGHSRPAGAATGQGGGQPARGQPAPGQPAPGQPAPGQPAHSQPSSVPPPAPAPSPAQATSGGS